MYALDGQEQHQWYWKRKRSIKCVRTCWYDPLAHGSMTGQWTSTMARECPHSMLADKMLRRKAADNSCHGNGCHYASWVGEQSRYLTDGQGWMMHATALQITNRTSFRPLMFLDVFKTGYMHKTCIPEDVNWNPAQGRNLKDFETRFVSGELLSAFISENPAGLWMTFSEWLYFTLVHSFILYSFMATSDWYETAKKPPSCRK